MEQLCFFPEAGQSKGLPPDMLEYRPGLIDKQAGDALLEKFIRDTPWKQSTQKMREKEYLTPRLTAWFGDQDTDHSISGDGSNPLPWTGDLLAIKEKVDEATGITFNSVLLNYYRNGNDSVSWHDDMDGIPGRNRVVASISLGGVRVFDIRNKADHNLKFSIPLQNGSFLLMKGDFQQNWQHRIAKSNKPVGERVNLTFRISLLVT